MLIRKNISNVVVSNVWRYWYSPYLITKRKHMERISGIVVCDVLFKDGPIKPLSEKWIHMISCFRNDVV